MVYSTYIVYVNIMYMCDCSPLFLSQNCTGGIDGKVETYKFDLVLSMAFVLTFFTTFVTMLVGAV